MAFTLLSMDCRCLYEQLCWGLVHPAESFQAQPGEGRTVINVLFGKTGVCPWQVQLPFVSVPLLLP